MFFNSDIIKAVTAQKKLQIYSVTEIIKIMNRILLITHNNLIKAQSNIIKQINHQHHLKDFAVENEIIINIQNFVRNQFIKILNNKKYKSFRILQQFHFFYKFNIFPKWYTTDIFHVSDFIRVINSKQLSLIKQRNPLLKPAVINDKNQTEWALKKILNSQYSEPDCHFQFKVH